MAQQTDPPDPPPNPLKHPDLHPSVQHLLSTYILGRKLGGGSFGTVREAQHILTKQRVAIKIISRARMSQEAGAEDKVRREIHIMRLLNHPHIVRLYEVIETPRDIYLVMEFVAAGELFDFLNVRGRLHEPAARRFFQQLIGGIEACHAAGVVHRDLKPENLLLTSDSDGDATALKIADFGLSNVLRDGRFLHTSCGSPNYAAPEVISGRLYAGPEVDVWSAGCILFALLAGRLPFDDGNVGRLFRAIKAGAFTLPTHLSPDARELIRRMLTVEPLHRITIPEIRQHPWFAQDMPGYLRATLPTVGLGSLPPLPSPSILSALATLRMDPQAAAQAVQRREHTKEAVAYHLLADAAMRSNLLANGYATQLVSVPDPTGCCPPSECAAQQRIGGGRWRPGLPVRPAGGAPAAVAAIIQALAAHGCTWKRMSLYCYRCRVAASDAASAAGRPGGSKGRGQQESERHAIKFEMQLYSLGEATYLVDMQRLQGPLACYMELCNVLLSHIAATTFQGAAAITAVAPPAKQPPPNGNRSPPPAPPQPQPQQYHVPQQRAPPQQAHVPAIPSKASAHGRDGPPPQTAPNQRPASPLSPNHVPQTPQHPFDHQHPPSQQHPHMRPGDIPTGGRPHTGAGESQADRLAATLMAQQQAAVAAAAAANGGHLSATHFGNGNGLANGAAHGFKHSGSALVNGYPVGIRSSVNHTGSDMDLGP